MSVRRYYYCVDPIKGEDKIKINYINYLDLKETEEVEDKLIDDFDVIPNKVIAKVYKSIFNNTHLMSSKKLPVLYANVIYSKKIHDISVFKIFFLANIDQDVTSAQQLLNAQLKSFFSTEVLIQGQLKSLDPRIPIYCGEKKLIQRFKDMINSKEMLGVIEDRINDIKKKVKIEYQEERDHFVLPKDFLDKTGKNQ